MASCMFEYVQCDICHENTQRKDMSVFNGICDRCLTRHTCPCVDCGTLLAISIIPYEVLPRVIYYDSARRHTPLCQDCYHTRDGYVSWSPTPLNTPFATYQRIRSKRKYGVEIETSSCAGYEELRNHTTFGCKGDGSISGKEFPSPVLYGDEGFAELAEFLAFARARDWTVNRDCGCHTHFDMRDETDQELYRIAYAYAKTYTFWSRCVGPQRRRNSYCHSPQYISSDIRRHCAVRTRFTHFATSQQRYDYVNLSAYNRFKTFEVRLLEGTLSPRTICNWVTIHARFMDYVKGLSFGEIDELFGGDAAIECILSAIVKIIEDSSLINWLARRMTRICRRENNDTRCSRAAFGEALAALVHPSQPVTPPSEEPPEQDSAPQPSSEPGEESPSSDYERRRYEWCGYRPPYVITPDPYFATRAASVHPSQPVTPPSEEPPDQDSAPQPSSEPGEESPSCDYERWRDAGRGVFDTRRPGRRDGLGRFDGHGGLGGGFGGHQLDLNLRALVSQPVTPPSEEPPYQGVTAQISPASRESDPYLRYRAARERLLGTPVFSPTT